VEVDNRRRAYHEAGHVVVGNSVHMRIKSITIEPRFIKDFIVYETRWYPDKKNFSTKDYFENIVTKLAGAKAERIFSGGIHLRECRIVGSVFCCQKAQSLVVLTSFPNAHTLAPLRLNSI
jgi:hypothetical protein